MTINRKNRLELLKNVSGVLSPGQFERKLLVWQQTIRVTNQVKRVFDVVVSTVCLLLLSPLFLLTALCIYLENPGPVFYCQTRVGKDGKHFRFYKFRSMVVDAEKLKDDLAGDNQSEDGVIFKIKNDPRITKVGKFIRKFSIDELPQLFNVLQGSMSLVGPRPALPEEVVQYTLEQRKRLYALPGITCLWQVSGRSEIPFTGQVKLDVEYIKSTSLLTDISILLRTIPAVLAGKGAY
jgi:exopolysaccharide biosynthesis polyprenyl glycosylphosphotransferase